VAAVLEWLDTGEDLALVSDAGTPVLSDPGERLVPAVLEAGHSVVPIPGPSAILAALVASGLPTGRFTFLGFLPRRGKERREIIERLAAPRDTVVLFESPARLLSLLEELEALSGPDRRCVVGRELTKLHEEFVRGTVGEVRDHFASRPPRGEITLVLEAVEGPIGSRTVDREAARALAKALLEEGMRPSHVAREVARRLHVPRNEAYRVVQDMGGSESGNGAASP
jgi:16S rRNA (cytidine1402-2'-O)-methyltransferase